MVFNKLLKISKSIMLFNLHEQNLLVFPFPKIFNFKILLDQLECLVNERRPLSNFVHNINSIQNIKQFFPVQEDLTRSLLKDTII
jgi:hypothetical protein